MAKRRWYGYGKMGWSPTIDGAIESGRCSVCGEKMSKYASSAGYTSHKECKDSRTVELSERFM